MIARLQGTIAHKSPDELVIDVNGVGYGLCVSLTTFYQLPEAGEKVLLYIYTHVREDVLQLYGFLGPEEKRVFKLLLGVSKVGPRLARNILSGLSARELARAIGEGDVAAICAIPGVGRKTGERMIIELRDKIGPPEAAASKRHVQPDNETDAVSALLNLGYKQVSAQKIVKKILAEQFDLPLDKLIKEALKGLGHV